MVDLIQQMLLVWELVQQRGHFWGEFQALVLVQLVVIPILSLRRRATGIRCPALVLNITAEENQDIKEKHINIKKIIKNAKQPVEETVEENTEQNVEKTEIKIARKNIDSYMRSVSNATVFLSNAERRFRPKVRTLYF